MAQGTGGSVPTTLLKDVHTGNYWDIQGSLWVTPEPRLAHSVLVVVVNRVTYASGRRLGSSFTWKPPGNLGPHAKQVQILLHFSAACDLG